MDRKTGGVIESVGGSEGFEKLVERGRQLHNQAVFELFARLVSSAILSLKKGYRGYPGRNTRMQDAASA